MKLKGLKTNVLRLIAASIILIVSSYPTYSQKGINKDSLVVISKVTAQHLLLELKDYDTLKKINALYVETDSMQNAIIKNDSLQISLYKGALRLSDSLYHNCKIISDNNLKMYKAADIELGKQKRIKIGSFIVSAALLILLIIK